jgi:hypothetical protein
VKKLAHMPCIIAQNSQERATNLNSIIHQVSIEDFLEGELLRLPHWTGGGHRGGAGQALSYIRLGAWPIQFCWLVIT